jgi:hypothetical protein
VNPDKEDKIESLCVGLLKIMHIDTVVRMVSVLCCFKVKFMANYRRRPLKWLLHHSEDLRRNAKSSNTDYNRKRRHISIYDP